VAKFLAGKPFKALEKHIDEGKKETKDVTETEDASAGRDNAEVKDAFQA